jgi:lysozyme
MTAVKLAGALIRMAEGCKLKAYWDEHGRVWTVGFGSTKNVTKDTVITLETAYEWLARDTAPLQRMVEKAEYPLHKQAALISFGYNLGIGALARFIDGVITVTEDGFVKDGQPYGRIAGGKFLEGLDARRRLEAALILSSKG